MGEHGASAGFICNKRTIPKFSQEGGLMTPVELAAKVYEQEPCARPFTEDLHWHLINGFVFSTPDFFIMGRPVPLTADHSLILNPAWVFPPELCNTWFVYLMAGNYQKAWSILPWELPYFAWERKNELRFYSLASIRRLSGIK